MRVQSAFYHLEAFWQIELPEGFPKFQKGIPTPNHIYQDVQPALLLLNRGDEALDRPPVHMVNDGGDSYPSAHSHSLRCFFNRLQPQGTASRQVSGCS